MDSAKGRSLPDAWSWATARTANAYSAVAAAIGSIKLGASDVSEIKLVFSIPRHRPTPNFPPTWNAAPTDPLPVVRYDRKAGERSLDILRWGLVPFWSKDIKVGFANINAMAETIDTKPAFREAFQRRRCLVPVDNFYEWKKTETGKQPYAIALADRRLMALAGLWENWRSPAGEWVRSFAIITTKPNELCAELHNRMPVVLKPKDWPPWLAEEPADAARLKSMLGPYPSKEMTCWPVSQRPMKVKQLGVTAPTHRSADLTRRTARMGLVGAGRAAGIHNVAADHQALAPGAVSSCRSRARRRVALRRR